MAEYCGVQAQGEKREPWARVMRGAVAAIAAVSLLFSGQQAALATWGDKGVTGYDGKKAEVEEPAIIFPIDTVVNGKLTDNDGTKLPSDKTYDKIKDATKNGENQVDFQVFYFGMLSGGMNDAYGFYDEETYGYRTNAKGDTYYAYALVDEETGNPVYFDDDGTKQTINLLDPEDVAG